MTRARSLSQLANSSVFTVATNNRVGIGSEVPTAKLDVDGTLNVSGNATIGGVATYEDVTNVDSVGIVTARSGVSVPDGQKIQLGAGNDLQIYHNGSDSYIQDAGTGDLIILANNLRVANTSGTNYITGISGGAVTLLHGGNAKLATSSAGVSITGAATFTGDLNTGSFSSGSTTSAGTNVLASGQINIQQASGSTGYFTRGFEGTTETYYVKADGSAAFSSSITAQNTILANRTGSTQTAFQATLSGVTKVDIKAGGAATFADTVMRGTYSSGSSTVRGSILGDGLVAAQQPAANSGTAVVWQGLHGTSQTSKITADGSATFSGGNFIISSGGTILADNGGNPASAAKVNINSNGAATFAGTIKSGALDLSNTSAAGIEVRSTGEILLQRPSSQSTSSLIDGRLGNTQNVNILGNGSASFGQASNSTNNNGILLGADVGQFNLYTTRYSTDAFQILNTSGSGTNVAVRFDGDGSATFAGSVSATVGSFSGNVTSARTSSSHTCFNGTLNGTTTSNILADGSATFEGAVAVNNLLYARQDTGSSDAFSVYSGGLAGSNKTANISGNGSATFGGDILSTKSAGTIKAESSAHSKFAALYAGDGSNDSAVLWSSGALRFYNTTERMRLDSSGNLGIGAIPSRKLTVGGDINVASGSNIESTSSSGTLRIQGGSTYPGGNILLGGGNGTNDIRFRTTGGSTTQTERMRITSAGSLKITANSMVDNIYSGAAATGTSAVVFRGSHSATVGDPGSGTDSIYIYANGNIQNTNNSYGQISDVKLKENIVDAGSQWDDFKAIRFRKYNFKEETGHETFTQLGVIAQELETVCPGLVYETADRDKEGNDLGTTTKAVKSSILTNKALVALQEAMERIETLESEVAALKAS